MSDQRVQNALLKALGLEGRRIMKLVITAEGQNPLRVEADEEALTVDGRVALIERVFEATAFSELKEPVPSGG